VGGSLRAKSNSYKNIMVWHTNYEKLK